jgi:hypothetical protein
LGLFLLACAPDVAPIEMGVPIAQDLGLAYERCSTYCLRPADCLIAYPSDEFCPAGYRCAYLFTCTADGGP